MRRHTLAAAVLALALPGCEQVASLDERPQTFLSNEQFFRSAADANAAVLSAYQPFQGLEYYGVRFVSNTLQFEDAVAGRGSYAPGAAFACDQTCMARLWGSWADMYRGINRANVALARIPDVAMDETTRARYLAESRFVRALNYFNLVRYWGAVPLRLEPSAGYDELALPRSPAPEVYRQIVADLEDAETKLPDTNDNGRATRWAAKALLAEVYLAQDRWAQAAAKAKEVMDAGRFALVEVKAPGDFDRLFGAGVRTSPEEIFDVPFARQANYGSELPALLHQSNTPYATNAYHGLFGNMRSYLATWDPNDLRHQYGLYVGADAARFNNAAEPQHFKKYSDGQAPARNAHGIDFHVLRYADVLLIYAEAASQAAGGPTAAAYDAANRIRRRAYGLALGAPSARDLPAGLSAAAFRDALIAERALEFAGEGKRYWDLKRTGTLAAATAAAGKTYDAKYMLWPLPQDELDANRALKATDQNPGW